MNRLAFLSPGAAVAAVVIVALASDIGHAQSRAGGQGRAGQGRAAVSPSPPPPSMLDFPFGEGRLEIDTDRDGSLYIPLKYRDGVPMPVVIMLHGLRGSAESSRFMQPLAEEFGVIIIAPESRGLGWEQEAPGFNVDSKYIASAIKYVDSFLYLDKSHIAIAGVSDGATYALGMGLAYGGTPFTHVMGFSEGIVQPYMKSGKPKVFISHGTSDAQMPIDRTSQRFVPELRKQGYDVTYHEYPGGHGAPTAEVRQAFEWFLKDVKR